MTLRADVKITNGTFDLDAHLEIEPGKVVAIVGPNGAGKSTMLSALAGLKRLRDGRISIDDLVLDCPSERVFLPPERRPIGVVFQSLLLFPHLSAVDNVAFGLRCNHVKRLPAREQAAEWLGRVGLSGLEDRKPSQLSGGQAQRVALARALATHPKMLLLDEPLSALDASTRSEVRRDLKNGLASFDGVQVIVTHDPAEAMALADHLVVMEDGRVVQTGTSKEVAARPRSSYVATFVGVNLFAGHARGGRVMLDDGGVLFAAAAADGRVFAKVHPRHVTVHRLSPDGSARNSWRGTVRGMDDEGEVVRVVIDGEQSIVAELTWSAVAELGLATGVEVWASAKATEVECYPA
ncbi:ABC transporter ATP-binding protein [Actinokineospora xionganensis]|uniref:ABC transporter ATP-binding protein n=1 Tax=Actinokineospora xionganensis TaxID=2684470 RepID=A0ABR7L087_9PSEU|nr:ABC transporter ATP-binding protein [Actinokineospora xionganensis]MBC6445943.1 ABC transporter ATP-binding protein [Actinokineospora xionganensis]